MNDHLVSIIMPTYNSAKFIKKSIDSVIKQTFKNWELIIIDNESSDNTIEIIQGFNNPKIISFKINNNGVVAKSRNLGINIANGFFLAFLDSDDWWEETKLAKSIEIFNKGYDLVHHDLFIVEDLKINTNKAFNFRTLKLPIFKSLLFNGNAIINSSVMVKTELVRKLGGFDCQTDLIASEDYDLWLKIATHTDKFYKIPEVLGWYWQGGGNLSKNKDFSIAYKIISKKYTNKLGILSNSYVHGYYNYLKGCHYYFAKKYKQAILPFLKSLFLSTYYTKLKSFYRLFKINILIISKLNTNKFR